MQAHIPDVTTPEGLLDIVSVGNILEFSAVFEPASRRGLKEVVEERNLAMWRYRLFQRWFNSRYIIEIDGENVNPSYIFHRSLVDFGVALYFYAKRWESHAEIGLTPVKLRELIVNHIRMDWQYLSTIFLDLLSQDLSNSHSLRWRGPNFTIVPRPQHGVDEMREWSGHPIYREDLTSDEEDFEDSSSSGKKRTSSFVGGTSSYNGLFCS
jgi:hypothetical protein